MDDTEASSGDTSGSLANDPAVRARIAVYYTLLISQTLSLIGSQISAYAVSIAVFRETGQATPLALVAVFQTLPWVLLGGFAGAFADRFDRRTIMLVCSLGFVVTNSLLLLSFVSGAFQLWHLYALSLVAAALATFARPAFQASITMLVPDSHRDRANAFAQMTDPTAGIIAPAAAGLLYAVIGVPGAIAIDIATFVIAIGVLAYVRIPMPTKRTDQPERAPPIWRQTFDGFRELAKRPVLFGVCAYVAVVNFIANIAFVLLTAYVLARTDSPQMLGVVMAAMNAGGLAGALAISAGVRFGSRMNTVMIGLITAGFFLALIGTAQSTPALAVVLFLELFVLAFSDAPFASLMQAKIPPAVQGRVFAAYLQVAMLLSPLAFLIGGPLADQVFEPARNQPIWQNVSWLVGDEAGAGMGLMFFVSGVLVLAISLAMYAIPAVRNLERDLPDHAV